MQVGSLRFSDADQQYVSACLGKAPQGVVGVATRSDNGMPGVIINLPIIERNGAWTPFPTLYWLVDPDLNQQIADIERKGGVREVEAILQADPIRLAAHREDNALYAKTRWAVLNESEERAARLHGYADLLRHSGIGGVADCDTVKCLHAQYAYHLARHDTGTTVGHLLQQRFGLDVIHPL